MNLRQFAALVTLAALWGGSFLFIRVAVPVFGPVALMTGRVSIAGLLLWVGIRVMGRRPGALRAHAGRLLVLGAMNAALPFTLIAAAELRLSASLAAMLNATVPLFTALLGVTWLGERLGVRRATGLLLGVLGVGILVGWSPVTLTRATALSVGAMLLAAASYAWAGVYTKRHLATAPVATLAFGQQAGAAVWLVLPALWHLPHRPAPPAAVWALVALAVLSTACAYLLFFYLIEQVGPVRTQSVTYLIPLFGMGWGALFLGEPVTRGMLLGLGCILASLLLVNDVRATAVVDWWRLSVLARARRNPSLSAREPRDAAHTLPSKDGSPTCCTLLIAAALLACSTPALAQRVDENPVKAAEDAFGVSVGGADIGLYRPDEVRGFSPCRLELWCARRRSTGDWTVRAGVFRSVRELECPRPEIA